MVADGGQELVITGDPESDAVSEMLNITRQGFEPHLVTILRSAGKNPGGVAEVAPFLIDFEGEPGAEATAYLCRGLMCERPVTTAGELGSLLERAGQDG
jgi:uncharacterized protein YyaL (SSP411 family)